MGALKTEALVSLVLRRAVEAPSDVLRKVSDMVCEWLHSDPLCMSCYEVLGPRAWVCAEGWGRFCEDCSVLWARTVATSNHTAVSEESMTFCPASPRCEHSTSLSELERNPVFERHGTVIEELAAALKRQWDTRRSDLIEALNLRCPSCRTLLDPEPEGCAAVSCGFCAAYICHACMSRLPSLDEAHSHVVSAHDDGNGPWLSRRKLAEEHAKVRASQLVRQLAQLNGGLQSSLVASIAPTLRDLGLPTDLVGLRRRAAQDVSSHKLASRERLAVGCTPERSSGPVLRGRQLLVAASAHNWAALRQLTGEFKRVGLEVDWEATRDDANRSALQLVITFDPSPMRNLALLLAAGADIEMTQEHGFRLLHLACWRRNRELVNFLLGSGANVNGRIESNGRTALMLVCEENFSDFDLFELLLRYGADALMADDCGVTAFLLALNRGIDFATTLLSARPQVVDQEQQHGWKPLHCAAAAASVAVCRSLLQRGADANAVAPGCGRTPLMIVSCENTNVAPLRRLLLDSGANPALLDATGRGALFYALSSGSTVGCEPFLACPKLFSSRDNLNDSLLHQLLKTELGRRDAISYELFEFVVNQGGLHVNCRGQLGWPPLHLAAWLHLPNAVRALLNLGADPALCEPEIENTALHCAALGISDDRYDNFRDAAHTLWALLCVNQRLTQARNAHGLRPGDFANVNKSLWTSQLVHTILSNESPLKIAANLARLIDRLQRNARMLFARSDKDILAAAIVLQDILDAAYAFRPGDRVLSDRGPATLLPNSLNLAMGTMRVVSELDGHSFDVPVSELRLFQTHPTGQCPRSGCKVGLLHFAAAAVAFFAGIFFERFWFSSRHLPRLSCREYLLPRTWQNVLIHILQAQRWPFSQPHAAFMLCS